MWDMSQEDDTRFLSEFDGECVAAAFVTGTIAADHTRSGKAVETQQLCLVWRPQDIEAADQPAWYSMGQRGYKFADKTTIQVGQESRDGYLRVEDGPKLKSYSKLGILNGRFRLIGFEPSSDSARQYVGIKARLRREKPEFEGLEVERDMLLPITLLGVAGGVASLPQEAIDDIIIALARGKSDREILPLASQDDRLKGRLQEMYDILDKAVEAGKLKREGGKYV